MKWKSSKKTNGLHVDSPEFAKVAERMEAEMAKPKQAAKKSAETPLNKTEKILAERGKNYGKFYSHAGITQDLKRNIVLTPSYGKCDDSMREALDMIAHKIGRILNGNPFYEDSWRDIAGYATLVADALLDDEKCTNYDDLITVGEDIQEKKDGTL
jgi:hypothetical protein